jgi:6-pyruvoyltetrahydropterin/6-carboxytetrahydropterin synthase
VTVSSVQNHNHHIPAPGFLIDFKEIKKLVTDTVIDYFDHKIILSKNFLFDNPSILTHENLVSWQAEPSAENMLLFIQNILSEKLPNEIKLQYLKLFETKDSYAEWKAENVPANC